MTHLQQLLEFTIQARGFLNFVTPLGGGMLCFTHHIRNSQGDWAVQGYAILPMSQRFLDKIEQFFKNDIVITPAEWEQLSLSEKEDVLLLDNRVPLIVSQHIPNYVKTIEPLMYNTMHLTTKNIIPFLPEVLQETLKSQGKVQRYKVCKKLEQEGYSEIANIVRGLPINYDESEIFSSIYYQIMDYIPSKMKRLSYFGSYIENIYAENGLRL